jgi:hypothetical protein
MKFSPIQELIRPIQRAFGMDIVTYSSYRGSNREAVDISMGPLVRHADSCVRPTFGLNVSELSYY